MVSQPFVIQSVIRLSSILFYSIILAGSLSMYLFSPACWPVMSWPTTIISRVPNNHLALQLRHWARPNRTKVLLVTTTFCSKALKRGIRPAGLFNTSQQWSTPLLLFPVKIKNEKNLRFIQVHVHRKLQHAGKSFPKETELRLFRRRFASTLLLFRSCTFIVLSRVQHCRHQQRFLSFLLLLFHMQPVLSVSHTKYISFCAILHNAATRRHHNIISG